VKGICVFKFCPPIHFRFPPANYANQHPDPPMLGPNSKYSNKFIIKYVENNKTIFGTPSMNFGNHLRYKAFGFDDLSIH